MSRLDALGGEPGQPLVGNRSAVTAGDLFLDLDTGTATVNGTRLQLRSQEARMLEAFLLRRGEPLNRDHLLRHLYDGASYEVDPRIIDVFVYTLGRKLQNAGMPSLIETVAGQGYMIAREP